MSNRVAIDDIQAALTSRLFNTITMWNRLEGRPRKADFDRALKAEIRDPLWMLTKQWQMGEFQGDDAGSPVMAKIHIATTRLNKYQPAGHPPQPFENDIPLEGVVEQRPIPFKMEDKISSLDLRLIMGRHWIKMVQKKIGDLFDLFLKQYPIEAPDSFDSKEDAHILSHPEAWQKFAAVAGRKIDGLSLYIHIRDGGEASDGLGLDSGTAALVNDLGKEFKVWFDAFFIQPHNPDENAWLPSHLEYQFACSAPDHGKEKVYEADEYYTGRLDWFNLSINDKRPGLQVISGEVESDVEDTITDSFIPTAMDFDGMPNTRWWAFEDRKTYLGDIRPDTIELGKLLFMEFVLTYSNDWFLIPQTLKAGTISTVKGLVVNNVFGERIWINPTGSGADDDWQRWTMFTINRKGKDLRKADNSLLLLPTVPKIQEGPALEKFIMVRDEVANMVWAVETDIRLASGDRKNGAEAGRELFSFYQRLIGEPHESETPPEPIADIQYRIMNSVPENWIPFIPVHKKNDNREVQLQRAAMPRILAGDDEDPKRVRPRTILLREGLDQEPKKAYYIHEEEVPRAGIQVAQAFQRTRWYRGRVFNWLGIHKKTGRGEGSSNLTFDQIIPTIKTKT
jgi:hypothetical protein